MADEISPEMFQRLVDLASLDLAPEESDYLHGELNRQLRVVKELAEIPIPDDTPPASHGIPYTPAMTVPLRLVRSAPSGIEADLLAGAPESDEGYFIVPDIPHEAL